MPTTTIFDTTSFDTTTRNLPIISFNAAGIINTGGVPNPSSLGYNVPYFDWFMEDGFAGSGLDWLVWDVSAQFPNATYYSAVNQAVTVYGGPTTYYDDHGILGTNGSDVVWDDIGNDIISTLGGDDLIVAIRGGKVVDAGSGHDVLLLVGGANVVKAGSGNDKVLTNDGIDHVRGGTGHDYIDGGTESDSLWGDGGNDTLIGGDGDDMVEGGADMDQLFGGAGNDALWGGGAADTLAGGTGDDVLRGQSGYDVFVFAANSGTDFIADFNRNQDSITLDASTGLTNFGAVLGAATLVAGDVVIALAGGSIVIDNLALNQLNANQFDFV